jgi:hypothetical protein
MMVLLFEDGHLHSISLLTKYCCFIYCHRRAWYIITCVLETRTYVRSHTMSCKNVLHWCLRNKDDAKELYIRKECGSNLIQHRPSWLTELVCSSERQASSGYLNKAMTASSQSLPTSKSFTKRHSIDTFISPPVIWNTASLKKRYKKVHWQDGKKS